MSRFADFESYDGIGLAELVRKKLVTPDELLAAAIERVEARNGAVNAVVMELHDHARKAIADGLPDGPFRGVPYLLKDLGGWLAGARVTRGSRFFADTPPVAEDSEHVRRLKRAGLVIFGRTNSCELGLSLTCEPQLYGATKSPWDTTRISGGSSGGAAAAVGARMVPMAHASDGFGSIRAPASCCGIVGLKPTRSRNTMSPYAGEGLGGLSTEHAVTLSVRDCAALLDATAGAGPGDPYAAPAPARPFLSEVGADPGTLRIAFTSATPNGAPVEADSLRALREIATLCGDLGHRVEEAAPKIDGAAVVPTFLTLASANTVVNLASHPTRGRPARRGEVENVTFATGELGEKVTAADYVRATQAAHRLGRQMAAFHQGHDVLLTPAPRDGAAPARLDRHDDGGRARVLAPGLPLLAVHGVVQHHRPARDRPPALADRGRVPAVGPARRPLRRRGDALPPGGPAREGAPVVRSQAAGRALTPWA